MPTLCFQNLNWPFPQTPERPRVRRNSKRQREKPCHTSPPERESYKSSTWIVKVPRIIGLNSRSSMTMRRGQWAGICEELGTATHADTLEQVEAELREAVELQLNEMENLTDVQGYLAENRVRVTPIQIQQQAGFAVAGSRFTT